MTILFFTRLSHFKLNFSLFGPFFIDGLPIFVWEAWVGKEGCLGAVCWEIWEGKTGDLKDGRTDWGRGKRDDFGMEVWGDRIFDRRGIDPGPDRLDRMGSLKGDSRDGGCGVDWPKIPRSLDLGPNKEANVWSFSSIAEEDGGEWLPKSK